MWNFTRFNDYLNEKKVVNDANWVENYLRAEFRKAFIYTTKMAEKDFLKHSGVFEMFGLDFMLDDELNLWLIEVNASPVLSGTSDQKFEFMKKMLTDIMNIQFSYLRSRVKRVYKFIRDNEKDIMAGTNLPYYKDQFDKLNQNYLEPEYAIDKNSSFRLILDMNLPGKSAYLGNIEDKCAEVA